MFEIFLSCCPSPCGDLDILKIFPNVERRTDITTTPTGVH